MKVNKGTPTYSLVATVGANVTSCANTVTSGSYVYRVRGFNSATGVTSAYSSVISVKVR